MTWDAYHQRKDKTREALAIVDRRRDLTVTDVVNRVDPRREVFNDEAALLLEVQLCWFQRLSGMLDRSAENESPSAVELAISSWVDSAAAMPGARALLDANLENRSLSKGLTTERAMMAAYAGTPDGASVIDQARERATYLLRADTQASYEHESRPSGLVARLRSALAA